MTLLTKIRTFLYRHEAEMAKELLENEGIEVLISSDDHGGIRPSLAYAGGVDLLIKEEDVPQATDLLNNAFGKT
jgi:hypothetical protein